MKNHSKFMFLIYFCLAVSLLSACSKEMPVESNEDEIIQNQDDSNKVSTLFNEAQTAFSQADYEKSANLYYEITQLDSENTDAFFGILDSLVSLNLKDESLKLMDYINTNFDLNEEQLQRIEEYKLTLNIKDISLVENDIKQYVDKLLQPHIANSIPEFSSLDELNFDYAVAAAISEINEESGQEVFTFDEVEQKIHQKFGNSYDVNQEKFNGWFGIGWDDEMGVFFLDGFGLFEEFMGKVIDVKEIDGSYEAQILYFSISGYNYYLDEIREMPLLLQNNKVIGHIETLSNGTEDYVFYKSIDELTVHRQQFEYESDDKLIWTSCEIDNQFEPVVDFTTEVATQYVYDYFDVTEETVYLDMHPEFAYSDGWARYHYFRWNNVRQEGTEAGGTGGPYMWVSEYGQVYMDMNGPGDYELPYNPEIKFSINN